MVIILYGNLEICANVRRILCRLISSRHLKRSGTVTILFFLGKKNNILHALATCSELPSNIRHIETGSDLNSLVSFLSKPNNMDTSRQVSGRSMVGLQMVKWGKTVKSCTPHLHSANVHQPVLTLLLMGCFLPLYSMAGG